jgi:CRISPR-associated protein Csx17
MESVSFAGYGFKWDENEKGVVWSGGDLSTNLLAVLRRRLMDADRSDLSDMPIDSPFTVGLEDIALFLRGHTDDRLIEEYLWGLILVKRDRGGIPVGGESPQAPPLPRSYALLKLLFLPARCALRSGGDGDPVRWEPSILSLLAAGRPAPACDVAARRLSASGFVPIGSRLPAGLMRRLEFSDPVEPTRLAASLLIPVHYAAINKLKGLVIRHDDEASA